MYFRSDNVAKATNVSVSQRIRGLHIMRYINLLTYLLIKRTPLRLSLLIAHGSRFLERLPLEGQLLPTVGTLWRNGPSCILDAFLTQRAAANKFTNASMYRVARKMAQFLLNPLTLSNINRFSKFFHCQNQEKICNNLVTKDPTTPQVCRHTTLWNVRVLKATTSTIHDNQPAKAGDRHWVRQTVAAFHWSLTFHNVV